MIIIFRGPKKIIKRICLDFCSVSRPIVGNVKFGQVLSTVMSIQWDQVENATTYLVSYSSGTEMRIQTKNTSIILLNLAANTTYSIRVEVTVQSNNTLDFPIKSDVMKRTTLSDSGNFFILQANIAIFICS